MSLDSAHEQALYDAIWELNHALIAVRSIPRPKERERIMKQAREYAAMAGIVIK